MTLKQTGEWLITLFPTKKQFVFPMLTAFYYLKDLSIQPSAIELTAQALTTVENDHVTAMFEVLGGVKTFKEIEQALEKAARGMDEKPWTDIPKEEARSYRIANQTFPDIPPQSILWIPENSQRRREWISFQMAGALASPCFWYQSSLAWREMPEPLKEQFLQQFFQANHSEPVIFITEADLKDTTLQKMLQKNLCRVVSFYSPQSAPTMDPPSHNPLLEQGKNLLKDLVTAPKQPSIPNSNYKSFYYTPPAFTTQERNKLFTRILEDVPEKVQSSILSLYLLLFEKSNSLDDTLQCLEQDKEILKELSIDQIYLRFTEFYGQVLKMNPTEIQYAVNPEQCSTAYRLYRFTASILEQSFFVLTIPFRLISLLYQKTFAPLWALSKIFPKKPN